MIVLLANIKVRHVWSEDLRSDLYKRIVLPEFVHIFPGLIIHDGPTEFVIGSNVVFDTDAVRYEALQIEDVADVRARTDQLVEHGWALVKTTLPENQKHPVEGLYELAANKSIFGA
jgi:hypothetical protein